MKRHRIRRTKRETLRLARVCVKSHGPMAVWLWAPGLCTFATLRVVRGAKIHRYEIVS